MKKGLFIVFEGGEGSGKSTILEKIYQKISKISDSLSDDNNKNDYSYLIGEEDFDISDDKNDSKIDNVTDFNKQEKFTK